MIEISGSRGRIRMKLVALLMGRDVCVALSGGDTEHIGAVAVSQARPSRSDEAIVSATTSVLALLGHKEDGLARATANRIAKHVNAVVCVACGVHVDDITSQEVNDVLEIATEMTTELICRLSART